MSVRRAAAGAVAALVLATLFAVAPRPAHAAIDVVTSKVKGTDGADYWVTNHLVHLDAASVGASPAGAAAPGGTGHEFLIVWAGDANAADSTGAQAQGTHLAVNPVKTINEDAVDDPPASDFLAVIDADPDSPSYGKV